MSASAPATKPASPQPPPPQPTGAAAARRYRSWGGYPPARHRAVLPVASAAAPPDLAAVPGTVLPFAYGRSYGDSCLSDGGTLLDVRALDGILDLDEEAGLLRCEAGTTLAAILAHVVPRGWFLPVVPGTQQVSVGGAIANDIHGKNHHRVGTFGRHVAGFELLRSTGERLRCAPDENAELFRATIGGLGLTGLVLRAELRLRRIAGPRIATERIRFGSLDEFFALSAESDRDFEYTVAWIDTLARGRAMGRGVFLRGNHAEGPPAPARPPRRARLRVPFDPPARLLNPLTVRLFNATYWRVPPARRSARVVPYEPFFFPLDAVADWNRLYGGPGFLQYQCVVPPDGAREHVAELLARAAASRAASFLSVLKWFGDVPSPGMLSFPRPGVTLTLDFAFRGASTLRLLDELDLIVERAGGALYPAKDARMSPTTFQRCFPAWERFAALADPKFSSSFWERVTAPRAAACG